MNALDILRISAEIRCVVNLVFEYNTRDFVPDEIRRLDGIIALIQKVVL